MDVRLREWRIQSLTPPPHEAYQLSANESDHAIDLTVTAGKPLILEGEHGLSLKGPEPGNASYYYSYPRLRTEGTLRIGNLTTHVHGESWFDHEFSTSSLGKNQVGWDWFCIQLDDQQELMLYCMRTQDGHYDETSSGSWIDAKGQQSPLSKNDFSIQCLSHWKSPHTGGIYPSQWRILIPSRRLDLIITPRLLDQELRLTELGNLSYWEGASSGKGMLDGRPVTSLGYVELTGYVGSLDQGLKR
jgi:predicted secreted hydrolase